MIANKNPVLLGHELYLPTEQKTPSEKSHNAEYLYEWMDDCYDF